MEARLSACRSHLNRKWRLVAPAPLLLATQLSLGRAVQIRRNLGLGFLGCRDPPAGSRCISDLLARRGQPWPQADHSNEVWTDPGIDITSGKARGAMWTGWNTETCTDDPPL